MRLIQKYCAYKKEWKYENNRHKQEKLIAHVLLITHFMALVTFYIPWKYEKTRGFLMFSGGIERDHCHEMG